MWNDNYFLSSMKWPNFNIARKTMLINVLRISLYSFVPNNKTKIMKILMAFLSSGTKKSIEVEIEETFQLFLHKNDNETIK